MTRARDLASGQNGVRPFATSSGLTPLITGNASVTFPAGRFTQSPSTVISVASVATTGTSATASSVTSSGFNAYVWAGGAASTTGRQCWWTATQQTVDSYAAGTAQ